MQRTRIWILPVIVTPAFASAAWYASPASTGVIPAVWLAAWNDPPGADRPLQIVHATEKLFFWL